VTRSITSQTRILRDRHEEQPMNAHTKPARPVIAVLVGLGGLLLAAGPATARADRAIDGTAVIEAVPPAACPVSAPAVAGGLVLKR
jgi:hypothetical protein